MVFALLKTIYIPGLKLSAKQRALAIIPVFLIPALFLLAVVLQPWVEPQWMFMDFNTAAEMSDDCCHVYYGSISMLGIMLWIATAAVCLLSAFIFFKQKRNSSVAVFALIAGVFTAWLAMDDAFLLHEIVFPKLGVPQNLVLATYVVLALAYVLKSWRVILSSEYWILILAGVGVAASLIIDTTLHSVEPKIIALEDSTKFIGICAWTGFHVTTLAAALLSNTADTATSSN